MCEGEVLPLTKIFETRSTLRLRVVMCRSCCMRNSYIRSREVGFGFVVVRISRSQCIRERKLR